MKNKLSLIIFILSLFANNVFGQLEYQYTDQADLDGDGIINSLDLDDDNDGILDCDENLLSNSVSDYFKINGSASMINQTEIQLTKASNYQSGQAWSRGKVDFGQSFTLKFQAYLGTNNNGADGVAIVFQNDPNGINATGQNGSGIGAKGIANGIVLELDTYANTGGTPDDPAGSRGHGRIWRSSNQSNLTSNIDLGTLADGKWRDVVITWNYDTQTISYTVNGKNAGSYKSPGIANDIFNGATKVYFGFTGSTGLYTNDQRVRFPNTCQDLPIQLDTDNDGIPNQFDLDSDNDGCLDAIEGGDSVFNDQLVNVPSGGPSVGTGSSAPNRNICGSPDCVDSNGVPLLVNPSGAADTDGKQGQSIGQSQNKQITACFCYIKAVTNGTPLTTNHGISSLNGSALASRKWPTVRKGAWTVLEAKTKGFVPNILTTAQVNAIPSSNLVEGMMVYNSTLDCLQIYDGKAWSCYSNQTCAR